MKTNTRLSILIGLILMGSQTFAGGSSTVGPGNQAAYNCQKLGGVNESYTDAQGNQGTNCAIEQWQLFNEMYARGLVQEHHYNDGGMPNVAAVNCEDVGGNLRDETCVVEVWTLYRVIDVTQDHP